MWNLRGKVAIVTGGGLGIGAAISEALATAGAAVAIADINPKTAAPTVKRITDAGHKAKLFEHDVTSWKSSFALVEAVENEFGPIDILVNNAGVTKWQPFVEIAEADWDRVLDINLKGQFLAARAVVPGMVKRRSGRIVNLGSVTSKQGYANAIPYCISKFGTMGFTQGLAKELAPFDITVNTVCPGIVMTPLHDGLVEDMAKQRGVSFDKAKEDFVAWIPLNRPQEPVDVANMVAYLVSDFARNLTGGTYHVDGGMVMD
jgi:NAD(P)-dependent dehydrogenase (short-subunit alcohol dehydrogenase family)